MRINFQRTGGFAGLRLNLTLDVNALPAEEAQGIRRLLEESNFLTLEDIPHAASSARDEYQYTVMVETENISHTVHATDTSMPDPLRPIIEELTQRAREQRRR